MTVKHFEQPSPRSRLEQARARMYHDLVFECAERLFAAQGFDHVTMRDIAAEAGISPKTLYATFEGKQDIYDEIRKTRSRELLARVGTALVNPGTALERMASGVRAYVSFFVENRSFFDLQLREARSWGLMPSSGQTAWREGLRFQAELVRDAIAEGVFYDGDPELMAAMGIAVMQVQLAGLIEGNSKPDVEAISAELCRQLERSFRREPRLDAPDALAS